MWFIYLKCNLFLWWQSWIFSIITPVFSVTWSFINHFNMLIWCSSCINYYWCSVIKNGSCYHQHWNQCLRCRQCSSCPTSIMSQSHSLSSISICLCLSTLKSVQTNTPSLCLGNPYSTQASTGHLKCPTPPPTKNQSLSRKHSMELGLLSPAALSPMQSEYPSIHN